MNSMTYSSSNTLSVINNITLPVNSSYSTLVFFRAACHANPGTERNFARSSAYIFKHIFLRFSKTLVNNNILLLR